MTDRQPYDAPIVPLLNWSEPGDQVELFSGPIGYQNAELDRQPVLGRIELVLRHGTHLDWTVDLSQAPPEVQRDWERFNIDPPPGELYFDFLGRPTIVPAFKLGSNYGFIPPVPTTDDEPRLSRLVAHWINLPELRADGYLRRETDDNRWHEWPGRWRQTLAGWDVIIDSRSDLTDVYKEAKRTYRSVLTHTMQISKPGENPFSPREADDMVSGLQLAFSFALGRWASPVLQVGFDFSGQAVYSSWLPVHIDTPGHDSGRWWPDLRPQDMRDYLSTFIKSWGNTEVKIT